jgi:hypothetical protein
MRRLQLDQLSVEDLTGLVDLDDRGIGDPLWDELARGDLTETEQRQVDYVVSGLGRFRPSLVNDATVWGRAIFPLLCLAEAPGVEAQADVPLAARVGDVELSGRADGAFGTPFVDGGLRAPFLIIAQAKKGVEGSSPVMQLYGELLAAASLNAQETGHPAQQLYGCYTVADTWTFVRADVEGIARRASRRRSLGDSGAPVRRDDTHVLGELRRPSELPTAERRAMTARVASIAYFALRGLPRRG